MAAGNGEAAGVAAAEGKGKGVVPAAEKAVSQAVEKVVSSAAEKVLAGAEEREKESGRMIHLRSSDGKSYDVTEASARLSKFIAKMIDDNCADPYVPLPNVDYKTLVADTIKGKTPEEIREAYNIVNDLSRDEEEEIRRENAWAFE
ncbi:hypothetical protein E2562_013225 [Oryza meyeriana var. granulata]|uniref:SKP1 component dimerisation domain-containing protein n=1 Tax=Oryza meyeriana var. granulata TaxID=110450 RepID=A0A6G1D390_9ORYZ|nr:hypothetical protein E2562_013225 [Oryza meyeriana var. granulata]